MDYHTLTSCPISGVHYNSIHLYRSPVHARTEVTRDNVLRTPIHTAYIEQTLQSGNQLIVDIRYLEDENLGEHPIVRVIKYNPSTSSTSYDENDTGWVSLAEGAYLWINSSPVSATEGVVTPVDNLEDANACVLSDLRDRTQIGLSPSDLALEELRDYGVEVAYGPSSLAGVSAPSRVWSSNEIFALRDGVVRSAQALQAVSASTSSLETIFRTVMVGDRYIMFVRLPHPSTANLYFAATPVGSCQYWDPRTVNDVHYPVIVACNGNMKQEPQWLTGGEVLEEAVVHELGHVFDNRVGLALSGPHGALQEGLPDSNGRVMYGCTFNGTRSTVMGHGAIWERGHTGWGSPMPIREYESAGNFQRFIQNYQNTPFETAGDMFLNWVYRRTTSSDPNGPLAGGPCQGPINGNWEGFRNITNDGSDDGWLSGNVRYWWMDETVSNLLAAYGWSGGN